MTKIINIYLNNNNIKNIKLQCRICLFIMRRFFTSVGIASVMPFLFKKSSLNQINQFQKRQVEEHQQQIKTSISKIFLTSEQSQFSLLKVFAFDAQILGKQVTAHLDISLGRHSNQKFNDGEIKIRLLDSVRDQDVYLIKSFQNKNINDGVMELLLAVSCMKKEGAKSVTTIIPYFPYTGSVASVSPNQLNQGDDFYTCFASDLVKLLQKSGCDAIITLNTLMSNPKGFTSLPFINIQAPQIIIPYLTQRQLQNPIIIGSRANPNHVRNVNVLCKTFEKLNHPTGIGFFNQTDYIGDNVKDRNILLYSNLIRSGQTMRTQVKILKKMGANQIYSFGFHGLCTNQLFDSLIQSLPIQELMMTNSIFHAHQNKKVRSLSVAKLLAEVITLLSCEKSLSQYRGEKEAFHYYYLNKINKFNQQKNAKYKKMQSQRQSL